MSESVVVRIAVVPYSFILSGLYDLSYTGLRDEPIRGIVTQVLSVLV